MFQDGSGRIAYAPERLQANQPLRVSQCRQPEVLVDQLFETVCKKMSRNVSRHALISIRTAKRPLPQLPPIDGSNYEKMLRGEPESKEVTAMMKPQTHPHATTLYAM